MPAPAVGPKKGGRKAAEPAEQPAEAPAAAAPDASQMAAAPKKKRNPNPGVRVQGGRVYDSENGTTCHQCRQKTAEVKAKCGACTLFFCPKCLENRYQERVEEVNARTDGSWRCPRCRGDCNCSNCRKKQGKEATGQLAGIAKKAGFGSVKGLLDKNPNAKALQLPRAPSAAPTAVAGCGGAPAGGSREGSGEPGAAGEDAPPRRRAPQRRQAAAEAAELELVADEELPPRQRAMPAIQPLAAHKDGGGKRPRGGLAWVGEVADVTALPGGRPGAELAVVLEFLQVFGARLSLRAFHLAAFAAELAQPGLEGGAAGPLLSPCQDDSLVAAVHCRLLDVVRAYWNVRGAITPASWQATMRGYYAASLLTLRQAAALRWRHGPPAVAGEIFTRPAQPGGEEGATQEGDEQGEDGLGEAAVGTGGAAAVACVEYPPGGYWALPPACRVAMLHALVHDALECEELRKCIEESMGDALDEEKERKQQLAGVRREARVAIARERDQQIALMIASASSGGLTLDQQQAMLEEARQRAEAAASSAAAAKVRALTEKVHPPTVRAAVLGADRDGRRYLQLQAAAVLAGEGGLVVQSAGGKGAGAADGAAAAEEFGGHPAASLPGVAAALHPRGRGEGPLQAALVRAFKLAQPAAAEAAPAGGCSQEQQRQQALVEGQSEGSVEAEAAAAAAVDVVAAGAAAAAGARLAKRGRKAAGWRGKSGSPSAAAVPARAEPAAGSGKRRAAGGEGEAPKRARAAAASTTAAVPAADAGPAKRAGRRASPRQAPGKAAAGGRATRSRRAGDDSQLPLKVDDMLTA